MSIVYNPYDVFVVQRNANSSSFVEKVLSSAPNSLFFFDSTSSVVALPSQSIAAGTSLSSSYAGTSSYSDTASFALNVPNTASFADTASYALNTPSSISSSHTLNADKAISASYVLNSETSISTSYLNPGANIYLSNSVIYSSVDSVAQPFVEGQLWWDFNNHTYTIDTIESRLQIGQENYIKVIAGQSLSNGTVVYIDGVITDPDNPLNKLPVIWPALADGTGLSSNVVGVTTQVFNEGDRGFVTTQGIVNDLDTFDFEDGTLVYLSSTQTGSFTGSIPPDPFEKVIIGTVLYSHHTVGRLLVQISTLPPLTAPFIGLITTASAVDNGNSTLTIGSAQANFCVTPDGLGQIKSYTIPGATLSCSVGLFTQYVMAHYNGGNPMYMISTNYTMIDEIQVAPVFTVIQAFSGSGISAVDWDSPGTLLANKLLLKTEDISGVQRANGLYIGVSGSYITITSGSVWWGVKNKICAEINTSNTASSPLLFYYHSASLWNPLTVTDGKFINSVIDNGTDLLPIPYANYVVNYVYRGLGSLNRTLVVLSDAMANITEAQIFAPPPPPPYFNQLNTLVGRIIVQSGSSIPSSVDSAFLNTLPLTITPQHNDLQNIQGGTASLNANEYYHLTSASFVKVESGNLDSASYIRPGASFYVVSGSNGVPQANIETYDFSDPTSEYIPPYREGRMFYDYRHNGYAFYTQDSGFRAHLCKETLVGVHNPSSITIPRLSAVYLSGSTVSGQYRPDAYLAVATDGGIRSEAIGVIRSDIASASYGYVLMQGIMHRSKMDFDTDGNPLMVGDRLWLHPTIPGGLTKIEPGQPYQQVAIGYCSEYGAQGSFIVDRNKYPPPANAYAGITSNIVLSNPQDGTIVISTGSVNLFSDATGLGLVTSYPLLETTLSLITGSTNYIVAERTGSNAAHYLRTTDSTYANGINIVRVASLDINYGGPMDWEIHELNVGIVGLALANRTNNKDIALYGFQRQNGLTLFVSSSGAHPKDFGVTGGKVWYGPNYHILGDFLSSDTASCDTYRYTFSGSGLGRVWTFSQNDGYSTNHYNGPSGSAPLPPNSCSVNFIYRLCTENASDVVNILTDTYYDSLTDAINNVQPPPDLPSIVTDMSILVGFIATQSGSANISVQSAYNILFAPSTVTNHEDLLGLQGGQGSEHYHMTFVDYTGTGTGVMVRTDKPSFAGATTGHIPYWNAQQQLTLTGSVQVYNNQYVLINSGSPDLVNPEALLVQQVNTSSVNTIGAYSNVDNFSQIYNQNLSNGSEASTDICATADIGTQDNNFIDMGIASSGFASVYWPWEKPLDGYIYVHGGDFWIATLTDNKILFAFNNTASTNYADKTGFYLSGSLFGTSSWANKTISASWSPDQGATTLTTASTYQITASSAISASWAPFTDDPNALSASWASQSFSSSYADSSSFATLAKTAIVVSSLSNAYGSFTALGDITAQSIDINIGNLTIDDNGNLTTIGYISSSAAAHMSVSGSLFGTSSWSNNAISTSWAPVPVSASWASHSLSASWSPVPISASWASQSLSSSWASNSPATTLVTASTYPITSSRAITASFALGIPTIKSGLVSGSSFTGTPRIVGIAFSRPFVDNNYSIVVTGEASRTWTIQSKLPASFVINSNNNAVPTGMVFWQAIYQGEYYS